jgi:hypothetical protein
MGEEFEVELRWLGVRSEKSDLDYIVNLNQEAGWI